MKKNISYILTFVLLFLISIIALVGCNQEDNQIVEKPTTEENIIGIWSAERKNAVSSETSYLFLSNNKEVYLSTNITKVYYLNSDEYFYRGDVYRGHYSIIEQRYLILNLTQFEIKVETESENVLEFFNSSVSNFSNNSIKLSTYEIQNGGKSLKSVEDKPYQYVKMGEWI